LNHDIYYPAHQLLKAIELARLHQQVVAALYSSNRCPFCIALKKEQLSPRMRSDTPPGLLVVELDTDISRPFTLPDGRRMTAKEWGRMHQFSLFPTLVMIDDAANPITAPLVGYASRDFYPVYLEEAIQAAHATIAKQRASSRAR
jgi:thioredoxin-related protein